MSVNDPCFVSNEHFVKLLKLGMDYSFDGFLLADPKGKILYTNKTYETLSGLKSEEIIGSTMRELVKNGLYKQKNYPSAIENRRIVHHIKVFDKSDTQVLVTCLPIFNDMDEIECVVSNIRNLEKLISLTALLRKKDDLLDKFERTAINESNPGIIDNEIVYHSEEMKEIINKVLKVCNLHVEILLEGETGTGKSSLAKFIYKKSPRSQTGKFIEVNCGAIPPTLIESELFGYEKGAFTGASNTGKKGLFEEADNGIIFLDEIEELPLDVQVKLLSVLQDKNVRRIGSVESKQLNFQVIAASNKPLIELVKEGKFREDLFYRLNVISLTIPPLRKREEDIKVLVNYYLQVYNLMFKKNRFFSQDVINTFLAYDWPGNIRELENLIRSLVIISKEDMIKWDDLPKNLQEVVFKNRPACKEKNGISLNTIVAEFESELIQKALQENGSLRKAANALQITLSSLYRRMIKYNLNINGRVQ